MIVKNVITIIFIVITGTAFVRCVVGKHHRKALRKDGIGHRPDNDVTLSDFGDRRAPNPMLYEQHSSSSIQYLKGEHNVPNVKNRKNAEIENLKSSVTLYDNILYIFSYLLRSQENGLTEEQYTSLQTLYKHLKKKMVHIYTLLPIISKLDTTDKNQQTSIILMSLTKNLPSYIQCTAKYLVNEIRLNRIDLNTLLKPTVFDRFNYLANIDLNTISKGKIKNEEMIGYDKYSSITQKALGPLFVKLLYNLQTKKLPLSQELFGLILINLPNPNDDPVLEENVRFLYDLTKNNAIDHKNWNSIRKDLVGKDVYTLVFSVLTKCLKSNVQTIIKDAAAYVYRHLKPVTIPTYVNSNFKYIQQLTKKSIDIEMLLSAIPRDSDTDMVRMKNNLLTYFRNNNKNEEISKILKGFNKFAYDNPFDLLLALLTRFTNRISSFPNINSPMLQQSATTLLSTLIVKKYSTDFTPFVSPAIDILTLLESVRAPDANPEFLSAIDSIKRKLIAQPQISALLNTLIPKEKSKCLIPKQCLVNAFQQVHKLQNNIPATLATQIQNVVYILKTTSQSQNFPAHYSIKPVDVNFYLNQEKPIVTIETDKTYTNMLTGLNEIPYVWNKDKYDGEIDRTGQNGLQTETIKWEVRVPPTYIDSLESIYDVHPTTDLSHVVEEKVTDVSLQENSTDWPLTVKPLLISKRPRRKRPQRTSTTESIVFEYPKIEYTSEQIQQFISQGKDKFIQSSISESVEEQASPPERRISSEVITYTKPKLPQKQRNEQKISSETVLSAVVLPPNIQTDQPLKVQLSNSGVLVVTTDDDNTVETEIILPHIMALLKPPKMDDLTQNIDSPIVVQILQPLSIIFGKNYVKKILKNTDVKDYPTTIALLLAICKKALILPEVKKNQRLKNTIRKYISSMEYASTVVLLPIVTSSKKLVSNVVYSTFNLNDLTHSTIDENPPDELLLGSITVPLVNPKQLLESINPFNPYAGLLPTLEEGDEFAKIIRPLKMIWTSEKITQILGPDFQPLAYPNKGALLITVLQKLHKSKLIQSNPKLKYLIEIYIQALEIPSVTIQVSEDNLVKMMSETTGQWQPELTSLISTLPTAKYAAEATMLKVLEKFLADPTLLEKLRIKKPPLTMSRGIFLRNIFRSALSGKTMRLGKPESKAIRYYKDKIEFNEMGALPIMWMWVEMYVFKAEIQLGNMIQETVNFNELTYKEKLVYNDLITYLAQNPNLLQDNEGFDVEKYETRGKFIMGIFHYLLKKPEVNDKIKRNIKIILPHVKQTGAGAIAMPSFSEFKTQ